MRGEGPADRAALAAVLEGADLDPAALVTHAALPDGELVWALRSTSDGWFGDWQQLRALVAETGRWPLTMMIWGPEIDPLNRRSVDEGPAAIL